MFSIRSFAMATALMVGVASPVVAEDEVTADTVVVTVNGKAITLGHMIATRAALPDQYRQLPDDVLFKGLMNQMIQQELLSQLIDERSVRAQVLIENETRSILATEAIEDAVAGAVSQEAVEEAYMEKYSADNAVTEYNAAHILLETEEEAIAVKAEVDGGADFAETAKAKSTGPSGPNGGDLGWFGPGMMVEPFEQAVVAMQAGEVAGPVETQFGWHIIKLNESREKEAPALESVRGELERDLEVAFVEEFVAELNGEAEVDDSMAEKIDPAELQNYDLIGIPTP